jgi:hypothetical protein
VWKIDGVIDVDPPTCRTALRADIHKRTFGERAYEILYPMPFPGLSRHFAGRQRWNFR